MCTMYIKWINVLTLIKQMYIIIIMKWVSLIKLIENVHGLRYI